jgi:hypothetical protein
MKARRSCRRPKLPAAAALGATLGWGVFLFVEVRDGYYYGLSPDEPESAARRRSRAGRPQEPAGAGRPEDRPWPVRVPGHERLATGRRAVALAGM